MANLGGLFYKGYYADYQGNSDDDKHFDEINKKLYSYTIIDQTFDYFRGSEYFELKTQYPGLLVGIGNAHEIKDSKTNIKLGFTFDYTTGLPIIPASTVKGVLRSAFKHEEYIKETLEGFETNTAINYAGLNIAALDDVIFGDPEEPENTPLSGRDKFYDAVIRPIQNGRKCILASDTITPHRQDRKWLELAEPNPISLVRVPGNIVFTFSFALVASNVDGIIITKDIKLKLFKQIILDLGIGAKTNVGYGVMVGTV
jgi:CRISPR-associated protein Cmr6